MDADQHVTDQPVIRQEFTSQDLAGRYVAAIRSDADRIATAMEHGPLDRPVQWCPGWDLRQLGVHMGYIHRWARFAVMHGRAPHDDDISDDMASDPMPGPTSGGDQLARWIRAGAGRLADTLDAADPEAPTWHPFTVERKISVWRRRQAHETSVHRWDAECVAFGSSTIDPAMAADGAAEYLEVGLPRVLAREGVAAPRSALEIRCTDVDASWVVAAPRGLVEVVAGPSGRGRTDRGTADARLEAPAQTVLLVLTNRAERSALDVFGDAAVAHEWLTLPGW